MAVFRSEHKFYLFDSHRRDKKGMAKCGGKSVRSRFNDLNELKTFLIKLTSLLGASDHTQYEMTVVNCTQLNNTDSNDIINTNIPPSISIHNAGKAHNSQRSSSNFTERVNESDDANNILNPCSNNFSQSTSNYKKTATGSEDVEIVSSQQSTFKFMPLSSSKKAEIGERLNLTSAARHRTPRVKFEELFKIYPIIGDGNSFFCIKIRTI